MDSRAIRAAAECVAEELRADGAYIEDVPRKTSY
jgi:hypothetical protein